MTITMLKGKIHRATVTQAELNYVGSITVDADLLDAAGILEYEAVQVVNVANGNRFVTYTIAGERQAQTGDKVILMSYAQVTPEEAKTMQPKVVLVDEHNAVAKLSHYEKHGELA